MQIFRSDLILSKKVLISILAILIIVASLMFFFKEKPAIEATEIVVQHKSGKVFIEETDGENIKISPIGSKLYQNKQNGNIVEIQTKTDKVIDLHIKIPKSVTRISVNTSKTGNIKVQTSNPSKLHLTSGFGNIVADIKKLNKDAAIRIHTDFGNVYVSIPKATKVAIKNGPTAPILADVTKSNEGPLMDLTQASGFPKIIGSEKVKPAQGTIANTTLTPDEMKEDFDFLLEQFRSQNPLYQKNPEVFFTPVFSKPMSREEFYFIINKWLAYFHDGHTMTYPITRDYIDMPVYWAESGLLITRNTQQLKAGDKILSVGGKNIGEFLSWFDEITSAEHLGWVKAQAPDKLADGTYLRYFNLIGKDNKVPLLVENHGQVRTVKLPLKSYRTNQKSEANYLFTNPPKRFFDAKFMKEKDLAVFTLDECWYTKILKDGLDNFFQKVKDLQIHNVAIDLRKNTGGSAAVINFLQENLEHSGLTKDHVYIFTTGKTFSAAVDIVVHFKYSNQVTLVGMPPGNVPMYGGNVRPVQLPNSKIGMQYPTTYSPKEIPDKDLTKPIMPDILVDYTAQDFGNGTDPWIKAIVEK